MLIKISERILIDRTAAQLRYFGSPPRCMAGTPAHGNLHHLLCKELAQLAQKIRMITLGEHAGKVTRSLHHWAQFPSVQTAHGLLTVRAITPPAFYHVARRQQVGMIK